MDPNKIAFIICSNNPLYLNECLHYISCLKVPENIVVDTITITGAEYMTKAYNYAMNDSDAKYKVYLHQDTFIVNPNFISDVLNIFKNPEIGMIGVAGIKKLKDFFPITKWSHGMVYSNGVNEIRCDIFSDPGETYESVQAIDGLIMITQYDLPWREDKYTGWHYYDISQSVEFLKNNYKIVVPKQIKPWTLHDHGVISYANYNSWANIFLEENIDYINQLANITDNS